MNKDLDYFLSELNNNNIVNDSTVWEFDLKPKDFDAWIIKEGECFERQENEKAAIEVLTINAKAKSQCFQNAQLAALENKNVKYYEGLVYGIKFQMTIHHGFNVIDGKAFDITDFYNQSFKNDKDTNWHKEIGFLYYGIHIPNEFLLKYYEKLKNPQVHNPIILEYLAYLSQKLK